jgi:hypothetical protein
MYCGHMNTDETAKSTETAPLAWIRTKDWDGTTYRAEANGWKYAALQPVKGREWRVQGWGPDGARFYREAKTLKLVKSLAGDHATAQAKAAEPVVDLPTELAQVATNADKAAASVKLTVSSIINARVRVLWAARRRCSCPTPTHRMSCGIGARPKVVPQDTYDFSSDHLYSDRCEDACCGGAA